MKILSGNLSGPVDINIVLSHEIHFTYKLSKRISWQSFPIESKIQLEKNLMSGRGRQQTRECCCRCVFALFEHVWLCYDQSDWCYVLSFLLCAYVSDDFCREIQLYPGDRNWLNLILYDWVVKCLHYCSPLHWFMVLLDREVPPVGLPKPDWKLPGYLLLTQQRFFSCVVLLVECYWCYISTLQLVNWI